jgi:hypothetical protein
MDLEDQFKLEHLLLKERTCRVCGKSKSLLDDYYLIRKNRDDLSSSYSYECKLCCVQRIIKSRKSKTDNRWQYPDW